MRRAVVLVAAGLAVAAPARAAETVLGGAETIALQNGLRLLLAPDPEARSVDLAVWYDAGSRYDRPGKTGVAHLFEHLMLRGSTGFGPEEHARRVRAEGGTSGAMANADFTCFYQTLPPDALELAFRLEADRMTGLKLTQEALDAERRQVDGERARRDTPISVGLERLYALAFGAHPYGVPLFGLPADLPKLTLRDCREFHRQHYSPRRTLVTVVGGFRREDALAWAKQYLEPIKGGAARPPAAVTAGPQTAERRSTERRDMPVRVLMVGWRVPARTDPEWPALSLLATLLTRAVDAPLTRALMTERPLCLSLQGDVDSRRQASLFYLAAALHPAADSAQVETTLFSEVERLAAQPMREADLERAKRQTEASVWFDLQTSRARAQALGSGQLLTGDPRDLERQLECMRALTSQDLQRAARHLEASRRNVVWLLPVAAPVLDGAAPGAGRP